MDPVSITSTAVGWLMSSLVDKAVTALLEAWAKRIGLGNEFDTLKKQLLQLGALLTSIRGLRTNNSLLEELVQDLRQLTYRAENLLDELDYYRLRDQIELRGTQENVNCSNESSAASSSFGFRLASRSIVSHLKRISRRFAPYAKVPQPKTLSSGINLSQRMNELAEQLQKSEEKVRNAVQTESLVITACKTEISQTEATNIRQTSSFLTEPRVFGRDQERDQLINLLTNEEYAIIGKVPVLAIVGSGGVGKTTLARLVFNHPTVDNYFEVKLWICVSTRFDIYRLTREMLEGVCGNRYDELHNLNELQNKLKDELVSKRFLLVLDDTWEDKDKGEWDSMVAPLNNCMVKGSIILVTTRNQSVAKMVDARDIYLHGLDDDALLSFFNSCIFSNSNYEGNWRLRNIGQQIANKLKGNPLAAKTVSALLKEKIDERYWMKIRDSEEWKSKRGPNDIMPALRLSYEHMPFHLQRCFSYCAMIQEDTIFKCNDLVYLWMAQGFLDVTYEDKRMEDIGSAYFNDLFNRGFFQTIPSTNDDHEVYYTFHDLLHGLACMVSLKECLGVSDTKPRQIPPTVRHLSIFGSTKRGEEAIVRALACLKGENLSTIINWDDELPSDICQSISDLLKKTKFLRAMRLKLGSMVQQHHFIQNFVSLRYLSLNVRILPGSINTSYPLPGEICKLYHLEVFKIERGWLLDELPNNFSDLVSLRHFIVQEDVHSKIRDVGKLTSLQELNNFVVQQEGFEIEQLGSLKEIGGHLHISNLENIKSKAEANKARLAEKEKLDALYLQWNIGEQQNESVLEGLKPNTNLKELYIEGYGGVASPTWLEPSLIFLECLVLEDCKAWELLPPLGQLEFLKYLNLSRLPIREIGPQFYGTCQSMKFPSLEKLEITDMPYLEKWVSSDQLEDFPYLKKLKIQHCTELVDLPLSGCATSKVLERFPSLESLKIEDCPRLFQLPPLPYSSVLSHIRITRTGFIKSFHFCYSKKRKSMHYEEKRQYLCLIMDRRSGIKVGELLAFHELSYLHYLEISFISSLESLDLHSFVALKHLLIKRCQSLTSLTFGEHLICLKSLEIRSCKSLSTIEGLKSWVNLESLRFGWCPGFIAACNSALKEIERTDPDFSLSLTEIQGDSLVLLALPICKHLTSLQIFELEFSAFTEEPEVSLLLLANMKFFPFDLFLSLKELSIKFPRIQSLPTNSRTMLTEECLKLRNIKDVDISHSPVQIRVKLSSVQMICHQMDEVN